MSHNGNYTPTLDVLAAHYCNDRSADNYEERMAYEAKRRVEFDRAIAKVRADAKAEALREAVADLTDVVDGIQSSGSPNPLAWQTGALAMRDQLKIRADKLDTL